MLRVLPRDLFNEAKLLKCLGQLSLIAHDGGDAAGPLPFRMQVFLKQPNCGFAVEQQASDGGLFAMNVVVAIAATRLTVYSTYNSKAAYPLVCMYAGVEIDVFTDEGTLSPEFLALGKKLDPPRQTQRPPGGDSRYVAVLDASVGHTRTADDDGAYDLFGLKGSPKEIGQAVADCLSTCDLFRGAPLTSAIEANQPVYINVTFRVTAEPVQDGIEEGEEEDGNSQHE